MMHDEDNIYQEDQINFKYYFFKFLNYWYLFVVAIGIGLAIAWFHNQSTPRVYEANTSLLIRQDQGALDLKSIIPESVTSGATMEDQRIHNEIGILRSFRLTRKTIGQLDFEVSYYLEKPLVDQPLYHRAPFRIGFDTSHLQPLNTRIFVSKLASNQFRIHMQAEKLVPYRYLSGEKHPPVTGVDLTRTIRMGETVETDFCRFTLLPNKKVPWPASKDGSYCFAFNSYRQLTKKYHHFDVEVKENSTILNVSQKTRNVEKTCRFLDNLIKLYLERSVSKKDHIARETLGFIDRQIKEISDSLDESEENLQRYRASEKIMNLDILTEKTYENLDRLQSQKADIMMKLKYFDYLRNYLKQEKDVQQMVAPSSMGISDPLLQNLIQKLSGLYVEKTNMEINSKKENPYLAGVKEKISELRRSLKENISNLEDKNRIRLRDIKQRMDGLTRQVRQLPVQQRQLFTYKRRFELYNELYTYLLKKRSETEVSKAANIPVHEIIDRARLASNAPLQPRPRKNYLIALLLGLVVPGGLILAKDYFNDKITDIDTIEKITTFPVVGQIAHSKGRSDNILQNDPRSAIAEAFRSIRTNFQFIAGGAQVTTTLITSAGQGEGKSFISLNLATSFAMYGKKTILVSFDLRRPNLYNFMDMPKNPGLSEYLSYNTALDDIICDTDIDNLDVIPAGSVPPNPSELIASQRTEELFRELNKSYSYIIIDTPPVGLVTDAFLLLKYTTANLFVVRHNYTGKRMFETLVKNISQKNIRHFNVVVNDINLKSKGYEYHYGYTYNDYYY